MISSWYKLSFSSRAFSLKGQAQEAAMAAVGSVVMRMLEVRLGNPVACSSPVAGPAHPPPASS